MDCEASASSQHNDVPVMTQQFPRNFNNLITLLNSNKYTKAWNLQYLVQITDSQDTTNAAQVSAIYK